MRFLHIKSNLTKKLMGCMALLVGCVLISPSVFAYDCSSCAIFLPPISVSNQAIAGSSATTASSTTAMAQSLATLDEYLEYGVGGTSSMSSMGGGVIAQLQSLNDNLSELQQQQVNNGENSDQLAKIRQYNAANTNVNTTHLPVDFNDACSDASLGETFAGGSVAPMIPPSSSGGGGGGTAPTQPKEKLNAADNSNYVRNIIKQRNYSDVANLGSRLLGHSGGQAPGGATVPSASGNFNYCTKQEAKDTTMNCSTPGNYAGDDTDPQYLAQGALPVNSGLKPNNSLTPDQVTVANSIINNIVPQVPDGLTAGQSKSPLANAYGVEALIVKSRIGVIDNALSQVANLYTGQQLTGDAASAWSGSQSEWNTVLPNETFPANPSPYDQLNLEFQERMVDPKWATALASKAEKDVVAEVAKIDVVRAEIELHQLKQSTLTNQLLSAILSHNIDPTTTGDLKSQLSKISSNGTQ